MLNNDMIYCMNLHMGDLFEKIFINIFNSNNNVFSVAVGLIYVYYLC